MTNLSVREKRFIEAFADVIIPQNAETSLPSAVNTNVPSYIERIILKLPWWMKLLVRIFFFLFDISPFFFKLIPRTFKNMNQKKREKYMRFWAENRFYSFRLGFLLLKTMCLMTYFSHNSVLDFYKMHPLLEGKSKNPLIIGKQKE